ncbi:MAG: sigma-70 family RNA polymerase sigma factor [Propionicimonas sp.]
MTSRDAAACWDPTPEDSPSAPTATATEVREDLAGTEWTQKSALPGADGYRSPLIARLAADGGDRLTLAGLRHDVPLVKAGNTAMRTLADPEQKLSRARRGTLTQTVNLGDSAKERLVVAGLPLVKMLAQKELRRRTLGWGTAVTFDELVQEGMSGLLRGLNAYNPDGGQKSPTNYIGQWILTEMRRNVEELDNDFGVSFDAVERFRKIRAVRNRLRKQLDREPLDEEIIIASSDAPGTHSDPKLGPVGRGLTAGKALTGKQLDEERDLRFRVGFTAARLDATVGSSNEFETPLVDLVVLTVDGSRAHDVQEEVVEESTKDALSKLLRQVFDQMKLPAVQRDVIARRFGLPPYLAEESARDISRALDLHREKVGRVIEAFQQEMARPGGPFHAVCDRLSNEDLTGLGLGWVPRTLGGWDSVEQQAKTVELPDVLVDPLVPRQKKAPPPPTASLRLSNGYLVQFLCDYHDWTFNGSYRSADPQPEHRACPRCGRPSAAIRVLRK